MELRRNKKIQRSHSPSHSSLMLACQQENKEDVRNILERQPGAALQRDRTGKNALHYCAENSNPECANLIHSSAPSLINSADDEGYTPLHLAVISGNKCLVKYLLAQGADSRAVDSEKHSCVHWATVSGDWECLDLLINSGADASTPDIHGAYPVHYAAQMCGPNSEMGNDVRAGIAVLQKLLSRGVDVSVVDRDGRPPLLWAASGGSSDAILALVKSGADVNAIDRDGLTAIHCAASRGHVDCLETLITLCGAEVDKIDDSGCSALFYAVTLGHADCTNLLLNFGSDANKQDLKNRTPAHCGAAKGQLETLKILAHHKANLWLRNTKGDMPLHEAVQSGRKDLVEWLLQQHQGSVNVSNANGRTPLHIAAITNNVDMCKVLMDYGAFVNPIMRNSKGQHLTPLDAALHRGNRSCAKYLNLHGALPASKLLEKREYNRFTETHLSETLELSPSTKRRLLRDTSAQTETHLRDVDIQARVESKTVSAMADLSRSNSITGIKLSSSSERCQVMGRSGKPIIAKVYLHTKRSKIRRVSRKSPGYRRECPGEKVSNRDRRQSDDNYRFSRNGASTNHTDVETPRRTSLDRNIPSRKASQPVLFEESYPMPQVIEAEEPKEPVSDQDIYTRKPSYPTLFEESYPMPQVLETEESQDSLTEQDAPTRRISQPVLFDDSYPMPQVIEAEEPQESQTDPEPEHIVVEPEDKREDEEEGGGAGEMSHEEKVDEEDKQCACHSNHEEDADTCDCDCHNGDNPPQLLSVEQERRRSSLMTAGFDMENQSPLSSIRSLESTIKDSGFSDDVDRGHPASSSSDDDDREHYSDSESRSGRIKKKHIARYIVSSGAAETFRLDEEDEEEEIVAPKPRSSSLPQMKKREEAFENCPRLLNRPTVTKEVQRSLKKYQMERRLFYELQELKRKQITTPLMEEKEVVQKMLDRFRNHVQSPFMTDFQGPLTFYAFERYLYEQLRKLSMGGKIPKLKCHKDLPERIYRAPTTKRGSDSNHAICLCRTHKCPHNGRNYDSDYSLHRSDSIPQLPEIIQKTQPNAEKLKASINRSKSWDRLEDNPRKNSVFATCPGKLGNVRTSTSLPSLSNPFPRRVPAALLAAISERLGPEVHPEDTVVVEMSAENISSKMRHAFTVQEIREVVSRYEEQVGRKVKPIPLETVIDPDDDEPITFEIRQGKERNIFKLPATKLKDNKKWQVTFTIGKSRKFFKSLHAK